MASWPYYGNTEKSFGRLMVNIFFLIFQSMRVRLVRLRHRAPKHTNALSELHGLPVKCQHDSRIRRLELKFYFCAFCSVSFLFIADDCVLFRDTHCHSLRLCLLSC